MENRPVAAIYGASAGKTYAVVTDRNATPRMLVDNSTNTAVWQWESNTFGAGLPIGSVKFNLRFPGQYYDEFTGLHYNLNRYYNPELGRYMEPDPIGLEGGINPYVYADNNPINTTDPTGLNPLLWSTTSTAGTFNTSALALYSNQIGQEIYGLNQQARAYTFGFMTYGSIQFNQGILAIGDVTQQHLDKAWKNLERLTNKANNEKNNNDYTVYQLVATKTGAYPDVRGTGIIHLNAGDVWRYGISSKDNRYVDRSLTTLNLTQETISRGSYYRARASELSLIYGYTIHNKRLPPGNKIFR